MVIREVVGSEENNQLLAIPGETRATQPLICGAPGPDRTEGQTGQTSQY